MGALRLVAVRAFLELRERQREVRAAVALASVGDPSLGHAHGVVLLLSRPSPSGDGSGEAARRARRGISAVIRMARGAGARDRGRSLPVLRLVVDPEAPQRGEPGVDVVVRVGGVAGPEPLATDEAQAGAVRPAERGDRLG